MSLIHVLVAALLVVGVVFAAERVTGPPFRRIIQGVAVAGLVLLFVFWFLGTIPAHAP